MNHPHAPHAPHDPREPHDPHDPHGLRDPHDPHDPHDLPDDRPLHTLLQLVQRQIDQLERRMGDHYEDLRERLREVRDEQDSLSGAILARLDAHEDYHRRHEHTWGLARLAARHPFRLAALTAILVGAAGMVPGAHLWLGDLLKRLAQWF